MNDLCNLHSRLKNRLNNKLDDFHTLAAEIDTLRNIKELVEDMLSHEGYKYVSGSWEKETSEDEEEVKTQ